MKKGVLSVVDPRKSRSKKKHSGGKNVISVEGFPDFPLTDVKKALQVASDLSRTKNADVEVLLPSCTININEAVEVNGCVVLIGHASSGETPTMTSLNFEDDGQISFTGGSSAFKNLVITSSSSRKDKRPELVVGAKAKISMEEIVLDGGEEATTLKNILESEGDLTIKSSLVRNVKILVSKKGVGSFTDTEFLSNERIAKEDTNFVLTLESMFSGHTIENCSFNGHSSAIAVDGGDNNSSLKLINSKINVVNDGIFLARTNVTIDSCEITSSEGCSVVTTAIETNVQIKSSTIKNSKIGISVGDNSTVELNDLNFDSIFETSILGKNSARIEADDIRIFSGEEITEKQNGISLESNSKFDVKNLKIDGLGGYGAIISGPDAEMNFSGVNILKNGKGGMIVRDGALLHGTKLVLTENQGDGVLISDRRTVCTMDQITVVGGETAFRGDNCGRIDLKKMKIQDTLHTALHLTDCSGTIYATHINNKNSKANGIYIEFNQSDDEKMTLKEVKSQSCNIGIEIFEKSTKARAKARARDRERRNMRKGKETKMKNERVHKVENNLPQFGYEESSRNITSRDKASRCDLENCSFIMCMFGFKVDGAKSTLKGCSFIMSSKHSIVIEHHALKEGQKWRKQSKIKVRWPNYVEPYIDNGSALSNEPTLLASVTQEKPFCGSADFEPVMYLPTLTERIRQAKNLFQSNETQSEHKARVIMRSVNHMLILLKALTERLLNKELLEDPALGMFAATFQLSKEEDKFRKPGNTLVEMARLFESWTSLSRTRLFDSALVALNEAFQRKQVDEELFDQWVTPLEEMQRVCYVNSKYNRRRDYLLTTAKQNPLATWYFLNKESRDTEEGKRLRREVLLYLSKEHEENTVLSKGNFHASWVSQWSVGLMGETFTQGKLPEDASLRRAWADKLLDDGEAKRVLDEYKLVGNHTTYTTELDQLIKFEAYRLYEAQGNPLKPEHIAALTQIFNGEGFNVALKVAAKQFKGKGTLPGFLRRVAEQARDPESLLDVLTPINEDPGQPSRAKRKQTVLAIMSHYFHADSKRQPHIAERTKKGYDTCPSCLVQKLQPWNELKCDACGHNHRFCKDCMKNSMSYGDLNLRGMCPGTTKAGPCRAVATRREMEMAGMDTELIYNIIETRAVKALRNIKGWRQCDAPGCIGGRSNVTKDYFTCRLCEKMVTQDGGAGDPTVKKRLLIGLDGTDRPRGEGLMRECYHCAVIYEKGNACSTITCQHCHKQFSMTFGPDNISHRFDEEGVGPQLYVPMKPGALWEMGVFKNRKNKPFKLGQKLTEAEAQEVVRRSKVILKSLEG